SIKADIIIIMEALEDDCLILTKDKLLDHMNIIPSKSWIKSHRVPFDIINGEIIQKLLKNHNSIKSAFFKPSGIGLKILINLENDQNLVNFNMYEFSKNYCKDSVLNRSIHAYYDINSGFFIHIDGKALLFEKENYNPLIFTFNNIKRRHKRKLFRIDGDIPNKYFISLTTRFFFENELISEFFDCNSVEENIVNTLENIKA
ncbi:MAG: hypothetical protein KAX33_11585, partial [Candidatus Lokiarchaeota archaeon]|nr:hypothetical protein [Candidatus Lokiarchaeota archaeon]